MDFKVGFGNYGLNTDYQENIWNSQQMQIWMMLPGCCVLHYLSQDIVFNLHKKHKKQKLRGDPCLIEYDMANIKEILDYIQVS